MARVWLKSLFLFSFIFFAKAEDCVVYDFENNVDVYFENVKSVCSTAMLPWTVGNYSQVAVDSPDPNSSSFVSARPTLSCSSTFDFTMSSGGTVEVNVYMESTSSIDSISVLVFQVIPGGDDVVVGSEMLFPSSPSFINGWQTLRVNLVQIGTFVGYISFLGLSSETSKVLVDSFRYIPPAVDSSSCTIYETETVDPTTEKPTTQRTDGIEDCVTYNFETDFEIRFTTANYLCEGFLPWHLDNYTSAGVQSPNPASTVFMTPTEVSSCISSFVFKMAPDGIIEANIYMETVSALDHIIVLAQKVTEKDYDTVAGFKMYYTENQVFVPGWNVLRFSLLDFTSFEGYIIFIGSADKGSTVLVDSVRYIPPLTPPDDASCSLY